MRKIRLILFNYIYKIAILIIASILVTTILTGTSSIFGFRPMFVVSESMEPVIHKYQFILAVVVDAEDIKVGDIVGIKAPKEENERRTCISAAREWAHFPADSSWVTSRMTKVQVS